MKYRIEKDSMGEKKIPAEVLYGIQTQRALENFPISGLMVHREFIEAYLIIKKAAVITNFKSNLMQKNIADAIVKAVDELLSGKYSDQFIVDVYQAGAGTSVNMNVNEVIANRALEMMNEEKGNYSIINPNAHVNMSQSTNYTYPTAMRIALLLMINNFVPALEKLYEELNAKSIEFQNVIKSGRTHLQDATPISLGQEFSGYASVIKRHLEVIGNSQKYLFELGIGGTAVGTGLNTPPKYQEIVIEEINKITGLEFRAAENNFESMQSMFPFVNLSNALANLSLDLIRIANDLRLLNSGPKTGLAEINLPAVQPGSSIMPGKVNPSILEMLNMVCFQVLGNNTTINYAAQAGQLELNVMMPLINYNVLQSIKILNNAIPVFTVKCVHGITANVKRCKDYAEQSVSIATILNTKLGYLTTAELVKESIEKDIPIKKLILDRKFLTEEEISKIFS